MSDVLDFDLAAAEAWQTFGEKLAEVLSVMDETAPLTIGQMVAQPASRPPFVRFTADREGLIFAEAASNPSLGDDYQLSAAELERLAADGWQGPTATGERPTNCLWRIGDSARAEELAQAAVRAFRDVYGVAHPVFLDADQLAEVLVPQPPGASVPPTELSADARIYWSASAAELAEQVRLLLIDEVGYEPLADSNGDRAIRVGSTAVFVRVIPDGTEVIIYAPLAHEVDGRSRAVEVLNDLNSEAKMGRFFLVQDRVFVSVSLFVQPFVASHFAQALKSMSVIADALDDELAAKLRGRTTF